ncbi:hypothetical protein BT93_I0787 [Corymbia citriodora subsp. variegata]|nr:hypothetical protein BT93_I0787 [Corymbia citriodora subsp. variegata]
MRKNGNRSWGWVGALPFPFRISTLLSLLRSCSASAWKKKKKKELRSGPCAAAGAKGIAGYLKTLELYSCPKPPTSWRKGPHHSEESFACVSAGRLLLLLQES